MFEFVNFLPMAGEFVASLLGWFSLALVPALTVAWGLSLGNETKILDDYVVWEQGEEQEQVRLLQERIQNLEGEVMFLLSVRESYRNRTKFLETEIRALARENDRLYPEEIRVKVIDLREVIDLSEVEVRLLEAHLRDMETYALA